MKVENCFYYVIVNGKYQTETKFFSMTGLLRGIGNVYTTLDFYKVKWENFFTWFLLYSYDWTRIYNLNIN